tara:strand:+ start:5919 stop:7370 length:1452 start_codon:yes stop_codon:yes gene_type:complete
MLNRNFREIISSYLPTNSFARGVSVLAGGTFLSQLLLILSSPFLTRLYGPKEFGILAFYVGILSLICVVSTLGYELAIPVAKNDRQAQDIVLLCFLVAIIISLFIFIVFSSFRNQIEEIENFEIIIRYIWLLPVSVLFTSVYNALKFLAIRRKNYILIVSANLIQVLITLVIQILGYPFEASALIYASFIGQFISSFFLLFIFLKKFNFARIRIKILKKLLFRYRKFPLFSTWEGLTNTLGTQLPTILFASFLNAASAGSYSFARRMIQFPMALFTNSTGEVFIAEASNAKTSEEFSRLTYKLFKNLVSVATIPALILVLIAPELFALIFGEEWRISGTFGRLISPWLYLVFICSPLSNITTILEQQDKGLIFQIILLTSRLIAIYIGINNGDPSFTIMLFSFSSCICWLILLGWIVDQTKNSLFLFAKHLLNSLSIAFLICLPLIISINLHSLIYNSWIIGLSITLILSIFPYWEIKKNIYS